MIKLKSVIGSNYGDEGKGYMTDYFASVCDGKTIVVCNNGGSQKGHTVETPDSKRHVFHHFGSGCFANADTFLAKDFILNPIVFCQEHEELKSLGINTKTFISNECRFSTPFDMMLNQILETSRGEGRYGSCGYGIWETVIRYREDKRFISIGEASEMTKKELYDYIMMCKEYSTNRMNNLYKIDVSKYNPWVELWEDTNIVLHYIDDFCDMLNITRMIKKNEILNKYQNIVFENSQGLLLDQSKKEYINNTTPSHTGVQAVFEVLNGWDNEDDKQLEVCYVSRSYVTKHGAGDFPNQCKKEDINASMFDKTNIPNEYQGTMRYGTLNLQELQRNIEDDFKTSSEYSIPGLTVTKSIAITHLNEYSIDFKPLAEQFDVVYTSDGRTRESTLKH